MAKKHADDGWDSDLDNLWRDDFNAEDSIDPSSFSKGSRTPVGELFSGAISGITDEVSDIDNIRNIALDSLPTEYNPIVKTYNDLSRTFTDVYDEAVKELKPGLSSLASKVNKIIPDEAKLLKKVAKKVSGFIGEPEEEYNYRYSEEEARNEKINRNLSDVFDKREQKMKGGSAPSFTINQYTTKSNSDDNLRQDIVDKAVDDLKDKADDIQMGLMFNKVSEINDSIQSIKSYDEDVTLSYQKKSLELKYRLFYTMTDLLSTTKKFFDIFRYQNEAIIKNTELPDILKAKKSEKLMDLMGTRTMESFRSGLFGDGNYIKDITKNISDRIKESVSGISMSVSGADMAADMKLQQQEMSFYDDEDKKDSGMMSGIGKIVGGMVTGGILKGIGEDTAKKILIENKSVKRVGDKVRKYVGNLPSLIEDVKNSDFVKEGTNKKIEADMDEMMNQYEQGTMKEKIMRSLKAKKKKATGFLGELTGNALDMFTTPGTNMSLENKNSIHSLLTPGVFSNKTESTISTIIPGYLSKLLMVTTSIRDIMLGKQPSDVETTYDFRKNKFIDTNSLASELHSDLQKSAAVVTGHADAVGSLINWLDENKELDKEERDKMYTLISNLTYDSHRLDTSEMLDDKHYSGMDASTSDKIKSIIKTKTKVGEEGFEEQDFELSSKLKNVKNNIGDIRGNVQKLIDIGYRDVLEQTGIIKNVRGRYVIDEVKYKELLSGKTSTDIPLPKPPITNVQSNVVDLRSARVNNLEGVNDTYAFENEERRTGTGSNRRSYGNNIPSPFQRKGYRISRSLGLGQVGANEDMEDQSKVIDKIQEVAEPTLKKARIGYRSLKKTLRKSKRNVSDLVDRLDEESKEKGKSKYDIIKEIVEEKVEELVEEGKKEENLEALKNKGKEKTKSIRDFISKHKNKLLPGGLSKLNIFPEQPLEGRQGNWLDMLNDYKQKAAEKVSSLSLPQPEMRYKGGVSLGSMLSAGMKGFSLLKGLTGDKKEEEGKTPEENKPATTVDKVKEAAKHLLESKEYEDLKDKKNKIIRRIKNKVKPEAHKTSDGVIQEQDEHGRKGNYMDMYLKYKEEAKEKAKQGIKHIAPAEARYKSSKNVIDTMVEKVKQGMDFFKKKKEGDDDSILDDIGDAKDAYDDTKDSKHKKSRSKKGKSKGKLSSARNRLSGAKSKLTRIKNSRFGRGVRWVGDKTLGKVGRTGVRAVKGLGRAYVNDFTGAGRRLRTLGRVTRRGVELGAKGLHYGAKVARPVISAAGGALNVAKTGLSATSNVLSTVGKPIVQGLNIAKSLPGISGTLSTLNAMKNLAFGAELLTGGLGVGTAVQGVFGALGAALASPVVMGGVALGVAAYGGYKLFKYVTRNNTTPLSLVRLRQYGLTEENKDLYYKVLNLEEMLQDGIVGYNQGNPYLIETKISKAAKDIMDGFDINVKDAKKISTFSNWFNGRFKPVFLTHLRVLFSIDNKAKLNGIEDLKDDLKLRYLNAVSMEDGPYENTASPFPDFEILRANKYDVLKAIEEARKTIKTKDKDTKKITVEKTSVPKPNLNFNPTKEREDKVNKAVTDTRKVADAKADTITAPVNHPEGEGIGSSGSASGQDIVYKANKVVFGGTPEDKKEGAKDTTSVGSSVKIPDAGGDIKDGSNASQFIKAGGNVDFSGVNPEMLKHFRAMVQEYGEATGKTVPVTSAYRTKEKQAALYAAASDKSMVAKPGRSLHEFGLALDVDYKAGKVVDDMERLGLMRKYGFTRPVGREPWHLEPAGIQVNIQKAKDDANFASQAVMSSYGRGGGGQGTIPGATGRNQQLQLKLLGDEVSKSTTLKPDKEIGDIEKGKGLGDLKPTNTNETRGFVDGITGGAQKLTEGPSFLGGVADGLSGGGKAFDKPTDSTAMMGGQATSDFGQGVSDVPVTKGSQTGTTGVSAFSSDIGGGYAGSVNSTKTKLGTVSADKKGVIDIVKQAAAKTGVDEGIMLSMTAVESGFRPGVVNPNTNATGLLQFLPGTWREMLHKEGRKYQLPLDTPATDPMANALMGGEYMKRNINKMKAIKPDVKPVDVYMGHFMGEYGGPKFVKAMMQNPEASAPDLFPKQARVNAPIFRPGGRPATLRQVYTHFANELATKARKFGVNISAGDAGNQIASKESTKAGMMQTPESFSKGIGGEPKQPPQQVDNDPISLNKMSNIPDNTQTTNIPQSNKLSIPKTSIGDASFNFPEQLKDTSNAITYTQDAPVTPLSNPMPSNRVINNTSSFSEPSFNNPMSGRDTGATMDRVKSLIPETALPKVSTPPPIHETVNNLLNTIQNNQQQGQGSEDKTEELLEDSNVKLGDILKAINNLAEAIKSSSVGTTNASTTPTDRLSGQSRVSPPVGGQAPSPSSNNTPAWPSKPTELPSPAIKFDRIITRT